jgi:hypothetical protein
MGFILQKPGLLVNSLYPNCPAQGAHSSTRVNRFLGSDDENLQMDVIVIFEKHVGDK